MLTDVTAESITSLEPESEEDRKDFYRLQASYS